MNLLEYCCKINKQTNKNKTKQNKTLSVLIAKFVASLCAFCKLRRNLSFFCSVHHLSGTLTHEFKRSWFVIRDCWISLRFDCFVFQGSLLCDRPVSGINRLDKIASQIFLLFLIFVTSKNKATSPYFLRQKSTDHRDFLRYSWTV